MDIETAEAVETLRPDIHCVEREVIRVEASLSAKMRELNDETKRHTDIRFESLHDDIRIIAEGVVALSVKVDSLHR